MPPLGETMKATFLIEKEFDVKYVIIDVEPRYIGDSDDDDMPTDFPMLDESKKCWKVKVDVETGVIYGWPKGDVRNLHIKVCDMGTYSLIDSNGEVIAEIHNGYVPNGVIPGSYGDYIELNIDGDGVITNWPSSPDFSGFQHGNDD